MIYKYKSKGSADDWTEDTIEAESKQDAQDKLDKIYGIQRDENGNQLNDKKYIQVVILD
jgi:hypothetical protein